MVGCFNVIGIELLDAYGSVYGIKLGWFSGR
jgi:hypothetical protein